MNNIPKGYRLVKVTPTGVQFGNAWHSHESITGYSADQLNKGNCCVTGGAYMKWLSQETPPQPIFDEAKERELFEHGYHHSAMTRDGDEYIRISVQLAWEGWEKCAQSRAKAVEVGHE